VKATIEGRNMYGCLPCPACRGVHRYPVKEDGGNVIACDDCGRHGPWSGEWGEDGYSADEVPPVAHSWSGTIGVRYCAVCHVCERGPAASWPCRARGETP
jgi:hypothetical protein